MRLDIILLLIFLINLPLRATAQCDADNIKIPSMVAPHNQKDQAQTLVIKVKGIKELRLIMFDRRGNRIFESTTSLLEAPDDEFRDVDTEWEGIVAGEEQEAGLYMYSVEAECLDKTVVRKSGTIVLTINK